MKKKVYIGGIIIILLLSILIIVLLTPIGNQSIIEKGDNIANSKSKISLLTEENHYGLDDETYKRHKGHINKYGIIRYTTEERNKIIRDRLPLLEQETPEESYKRLKEIDKDGFLGTIERNLVYYKEISGKGVENLSKTMDKFMVLSYGFAEYQLPMKDRKKVTFEKDKSNCLIRAIGDQKIFSMDIKFNNIQILNYLVKNQNERHYFGVNSEKMGENIKFYFIERGTNRKFYINNYDKIHYKISNLGELLIQAKGSWKDFGISEKFYKKMKPFIKIEIRDLRDDYGKKIKRTYTLPINIDIMSDKEYVEKYSRI